MLLRRASTQFTGLFGSSSDSSVASPTPLQPVSPGVRESWLACADGSQHAYHLLPTPVTEKR